MKKLVLGGFFATIAVAFIASSAFAASFALFGDAQIVPGGNPGFAAQIRSDASIAPSYGGVRIAITPIPWTALATLSADFNVTNDSCGGNSPRMQIALDTNHDNVADDVVFVSFGPSPSFTGCVGGWQSTGNLIGNTDAGRFDYSHFGGSPFTTYANAPALVLAAKVVSISVVVDGSWNGAATGGDGEQTVLVDNININGDVTTFDPHTPVNADACKDNGWMNLTRADSSPFKNQGDCVSYTNNGR